MDKTDLSLLAEFSARRGWVLSETRFRVDFLRRNFPNAKSVFASRPEAARRFLRAGFGDFGRLETHRALRWIYDRVQDDPRYSPLKFELSEQLRAAGARPIHRSIHRFGEPILAFIDAVRLELQGEQLISRMLDEFGEVRPGKERIESLFLLLEDYRGFQRDQRLFDDVGVWETLLEEVSKLDQSKQREMLPLGEYVILDQPTEISKVEVEVWRLLSRVTDFNLVLPERFRDVSEPPPLSIRSAQSVLAFERAVQPNIHYLPAKSGLRAAVVAEAVDCGATVDKVDGIAVWKSSEVRDEVRRVARALSYSIEQGTIRPEDIHLIVLDLGIYEELLENELAAHGLQAWVSRGRRVSQTTPGSLFQDFLRWLRDPSGEHLRNVALHPMWNSGEGDFSALLNLISRLGLGRGKLRLEECRSTISHFLRFSRARNAASAEELQELERRVSSALDLLEQDRAFVQEIRGESCFRAAIARHFRKRRKRLASSALVTKREREYAAGALRLLRKVISAAAEIAALRPGDLFDNFIDAAEELCETTYCAAVREENSIAVTELLDARAMRGGSVIVLGMSAQSFPPRFLPPADELLELSAAIRKRNDSGSPVVESYGLLAHLIESSDELVLSAALQTFDEELRPARVLERFQIHPTAARRVKLHEPPAEWRSTRAFDLPAQLRAGLIEQRSGAVFGPFDGSLEGDTTEAERIQALNNSGEELVSRYSPSGLEELADCPHSFFFHKLLGLEETVSLLEQEIAAEIGTVVHECLATFFGKPQLGGFVRSDFPRACAEMRAIAEGIFERSFILGMPHPAVDDAKRRVLQGLDSTDEESPRGYLKAALVFQRDLMHTLPQQAEAKISVRFDRPGQQIHLFGRIDRIDSETGSPGEPVESLWDYKTGKLPESYAIDAGRSLQVPLYALALERSPDFIGSPRRGGFIHLAQPNRRDEEVADPKNGVIVDVLGISKKNVDDLRAERMRIAEEAMFRLDAKVREGKLHQVLDTKRCTFCDFRVVCYRNEMLLARRATEQTAEVRLGWPAHAALPRGVSRLRPEQLAPTDISSHVSLRAGAGSGKTQVMCARIVKLVLSGAPITSIVAVTFTEDAAAEIRDRVERFITQALAAGEWEGAALEPVDRELLFSALTGIAQAPFGTIHSFAARLIGLDPVLSGVPEFITILEGGARSIEIEECVKEILLGRGRSTAVELLSSGIRYLTLEKEVRNLVADLETLTVLLREFSERGVDGIMEMVETLRESERRKLFSQLSDSVGRWLCDAREWIGGAKVQDDVRALFQQLFEHAEAFQSLLERGEANDSAFGELCAFVRENSGRAPRGQKGKRGIWLQLRDRLDAVETEFAVICSRSEADRCAIELSERVLKLAAAASALFRDRKLTSGALDFDDLIAAAHRMIVADVPAEHRGRRTRLQRRLEQMYRHVLVDEFQDTDPRQWDIVREIVRPAEGASGRTLFIVGDAQQSIYRFRGGDVRVFRAAERLITDAGGRALTLQDNHRAHPDILRFVEALFQPLFGLDWSTEGSEGAATPLINTAVKFQHMEPVRAEDETPIARVTALHVSDLGKAGKMMQEAGAVAERIRQILQQPSKWPALFRGAPGGEIAVLVRTGDQMKLIAGALESRGVPFSISHSNGFYDLEEVLQFENLVRWILFPNDAVALVGVLRSALIGLSDADLLRAALTLNQDWTKFLSAPSLPRPAGIAAETLKDWRSASKMLKPSQFFTAIAAETQLQAAYEKAGKAEAFRNIERFIDAVRAAEKGQSGGASLSHIGQWLRFQKAAKQSAPNANSSAHPVVLMTLHGAKGLEFPMVILPFLGGGTGSEHDFEIGEIELAPSEDELHPRKYLGVRIENEEQNFSRQRALLQHLIHKNAQRHDEAEERRLFYVGCTRAKDYLVLVVPETKTLLDKQASSLEQSAAQRIADAVCAKRPLGWFSSLAQFKADGEEHWDLFGRYRVPLTRISTGNSKELPSPGE